MVDRASAQGRNAALEEKARALDDAVDSLQDRVRRDTEAREALVARLADRERQIDELRARLLAAENATPFDAAPEGAAAGGADRIAQLTAEIRKRDFALVAAAQKAAVQDERIDQLTRRLVKARTEIADVREWVVETKRSQTEARRTALPPVEQALAASAAANRHSPVDSSPAEPAEDPGTRALAVGLAGVAGLRVEGVAEVLDYGVRFHVREVAARRPVAVLAFARPMSDLDGRRVDSLLLARHRNLASALSFGVARSGPYIVFERPMGETVEAWIARDGRIPERKALEVALQVARGLRHAAFHGSPHGDLSPRDVHVDSDGRVQVTGVGLGGLLYGPPRPARAPEYASPERRRGSPPPDVRSDLYSLGAILHLMLTGDPPFAADTEGRPRRAPDPRMRRSDVSEQASRIVLEWTESDPDLRPATWDQALVALERLLPQETSPEDESRSRLRRFLVAHPYVFAAAAAVPLVIAAAILALGRTTAEPTVRAVFDVAVRHADALAAKGDVDGARLVLSRFEHGVGDPAVEREASDRIARLSK